LSTHGGATLRAVPLTAEELETSDLVVITTAHADIDWALLRSRAPLVLDTRGVRGQGRDGWHTL
jgi:UDP-N-acetyl-D-mannosaminuronate dehydrogenase